MTILNKLEQNIKWVFLSAVNKAWEIKKTGYIGPIKAAIFKQLDPNLITSKSFVNKLTINSENKKIIIPEVHMIIHPIITALL